MSLPPQKILLEIKRGKFKKTNYNSIFVLNIMQLQALLNAKVF